MSNDLVILVCGVILLVAVLPMILMSRAFKGAGGRGAGSRKGSPAADGNPVVVDPGLGKGKSGHSADDSGGSSESGGGDGGGGGE